MGSGTKPVVGEGGTLVTFVPDPDDGSVPVRMLVPGRLEHYEAEELVRDAADSFFRRAGESYIRAAWENTGGTYCWRDVFAGRHYSTMYFGASEIKVLPECWGEPEGSGLNRVDVAVDFDERLFPGDWARVMLGADRKAGRIR